MSEKPADKIFSKFSLSKLVMAISAVGLVLGVALLGLSSTHQSEIIKGMSALDKFELATKAFSEKYGYLPGDIPAGLAMQLQFTLRNGGAGRGDGNGLMEGVAYPSDKSSGVVQSGENLFFWEDLYSADLIKDSFRTATDAEIGRDVTDLMYQYLPDAGLRNNDRIYVYSDKNKNYYGISSVVRINGDTGSLTSHPGLSVREAYSIDKKIDDGAPGSGKVLARYINGTLQEAATTAKPSPISCSDTSSGGYSLAQNNGDGINCGLSFVMADH